MSNVIQDYNENNNPTQQDEVDLPTKAMRVNTGAAGVTKPPSVAAGAVYASDDMPTYVRDETVAEPLKFNFAGSIPETIEPIREQPVVDLSVYQGVTGEEIDTAVKQGFQDKLDWVRAQQGNYTSAPVFDVTGNGFDYSYDTPQVDIFVPANLNWREEQAYQAEVAAQQAALNQAGYNIDPQTNVTAQQGGFNSPGGTAAGNWSIGGVWEDIKGLAGFGQRAATTMLEGAVGRKIQNPWDVAEGLLRLNPLAAPTLAVEIATNEKRREALVQAPTRNFNPTTFTKPELGLLSGLVPTGKPVSISKGQFGDYGSGLVGGLNYGLDNFAGGNTVRGLFANVKRNVENAANGRPQQWDEGFGVISALKGRDYSFLNDKNADTGVLGKDKHGTEFWLRAGGGFLLDTITDIPTPVSVVKGALKKAGKAGLKSALGRVGNKTLLELADSGQVVVEVTKKSKNGVKGTDVTTKPLAEILSPEKRAYYDKKGLVVVGAKQVEGPSPKKVARQAERAAKKSAKKGKPVASKKPKVTYEYITRKKSELVQEGVSALTPTNTDVVAPLNKVTPVTSTPPTAPNVESNVDKLFRRVPPGDTAEPTKLRPGAAEGIKRAEAAADANPLVARVVRKEKPRTKLAVTEATGTTKSGLVDQPNPIVDSTTPPVTAYVKAVTEAPITDTVIRQLAEPGAAENVIRQAELDGAIRLKPSGVIVSEVGDGVEAAQKELIRLRIEQNKLKQVPNYDLVGQPGTKLGNQVLDIQSKIDAARQVITGGRLRKETYDVITREDLDNLLPVLPSRLTDPLPLTPSTLYTKLKSESVVLQGGAFVERSMKDLSALAEYLGHRKGGLKKSLTAEELSNLRVQYGMVYSRVGEPINRDVINNYLKTGVGQIETKPPTPTSPVKETMLLRRNDRPFTVLPGGGATTPRATVDYTVVRGGYEKPLDDLSLEELFAEVDEIGKRYDNVELPEAERFAQNRQAKEFVDEFVDPIRKRVVGSSQDYGVPQVADVVALRPKAGDNVLDIVKGDGKKYKYRTTGMPAPQRGVLGKLEVLDGLRDDLLAKLDDTDVDVPKLQEDIDRLSLTKQRLEELDPAEARQTEQFFDSLPEKPMTELAENEARIVREVEDLVADTTQRVRDLNLHIEAIRQELDTDNAKLLDLPTLEPQPLDIGSYEKGLVSERIIGQSTIQRVVKGTPTPEAKLINQEQFWHGSSFEDALSVGPEGVRPTRNPLGLGHYLYRSGDDAEAAARSVLPDNHIDVGITPNENGVVQQIQVDVSNPLDATQVGDDSVRYAFAQAIRDTFGADGSAIAKRWETKTVDKPIASYWDEATVAWEKLNKGQAIPEDSFRQLEVNIANNLIDTGYDSVNHPRVLVLLDGSLAQPLDDLIELPASTYTEKLVSYSNTTKIWQSISPGAVADVHALNAAIDAGEALIDDSMAMLGKAAADNQAAVEQMLRASDNLSARLDADKVERQLTLQQEGSDEAAREADSLLKRDNNEHPGCL